jgi:hypothetical protein
MRDSTVDGVHSAQMIDDSDTLNTQREKIYSTFRIPAEAKARHQQRIRFMRVGERQNRRLINRLENCARTHRCKSEVDPVCVTLFQRRLLRAANAIVDGRSWTRIIVVTSGLLVPYGHLGEYDLSATLGRLRERLRSRLGKRVIIGAIDISLDLKNQTIIGWQLRLNFLAEGKHTPALQKEVKAAFPPEPTAVKPYLFKDVADAEKALAGLYSYRFFRRSRYRVKKELRTARMPLTANDLGELLSFLGRYSVGSRLVLSGVGWDGKILVPVSEWRSVQMNAQKPGE